MRLPLLPVILIVLCNMPSQGETHPLHSALTLRETLLSKHTYKYNEYLKLQRNDSPSGDFSKWKRNIFTTVFWIGEKACKKNPVPNDKSSWDTQWQNNYGGYDSPTRRIGYYPQDFAPKLNPFYVALPYNDINKRGTKPEAKHIVPWFNTTFVKDGKSTLKSRWVAIHHKRKICYAQWEDTGPFKTDDWKYVFGNAPPKARAGLDISPAVRDYLKMETNCYTDWKFVADEQVPPGPWKPSRPIAQPRSLIQDLARSY